MERMDCMEYMDQVVGNIFGNISKEFLKGNIKTDVTFRKMDVALVFFVGDVRREENGVWGNLEKLKVMAKNCSYR